MMQGKLRGRRPSPAMVVAVVALFAALGGVAGAALVGSDRSVTVCIAKDGSMKVIDPAVTSSCPGTQVKAKLAGVDEAGRVNDSNRLEGKTLAEVRSGINADKLDGVDGSGYAQLDADGKVANADKLDGKDSSDYAQLDADGKVGDADTLDGIDSTGFYKKSDKVAAASDGDTLSGLSRATLLSFFEPELTVKDNAQSGPFDWRASVNGSGLKPGSAVVVESRCKDCGIGGGPGAWVGVGNGAASATGTFSLSIVAQCGQELRATGDAYLRPMESEIVGNPCTPIGG